MKIVHISDLHYPEHEGTERLIDKIINHYREEQLKPIVVCSGDILDTPPKIGHESNYTEIARILKKLKTKNFNILICPGNHDLKKGGVKKRKKIYSNLINFSNNYSSILPSNSNIYRENNNNLMEYPVIHKFDNHFFIGLNSITYQPKSAKGMLGKEQLKKLEIEVLKIKENNENPVIIVYLHHNPLSFHVNVPRVPDFGDRIVTNKLKLIDRKSLLKVVNGINVLLFGHLHRNKRQTEFESKYNINCIQLTGGSTDENYEFWTEIDTSTYEIIEFPL
ncbi:MAG: metallophosphoesterase [Bacteroidota bacterium]